MKSKKICRAVILSALVMGMHKCVILADEEDVLSELDEIETEYVQEDVLYIEDIEDEVETDLEITLETEEEIIENEVEEEERKVSDIESEKNENVDIIVTHGEVGKMYWEVDGAGSLRITGDSSMPNWKDEKEVPWYNIRQNIQKIVVEGAKSIGSYAFYDCVNVKEVEMSDSVSEIGEKAFYNCSGLVTVDIG